MMQSRKYDNATRSLTGVRNKNHGYTEKVKAKSKSTRGSDI